MHVRALLAVLLLLVGPGLVPAPAEALPREDETWRRLETPHFEIVSNASEEQIRRTAADLEGLRRAVARVTALEPVSPVPTRLYLFDDDIALHPYKHRYRGEPAEMSGAFYSRPWGDHLSMNGARRGLAKITVFHEYLHSVLRNNLPGLPLWLEEGMAELFSTFTVIDGEGRLGRPVPWHRATLGSGERLDLTELLVTEIDSERYNRFEHQGELYARSWELAHYLLLDAGRRRQLLDYLGRVMRDEEPRAAFERAFGVTPLDMEARLLAYRRGGYPERRLPAEDRPSDFAQTRLATLSRAETLVALGDLLVAQGEREADATFHFRAALEADPACGAALAGLGLLAELDHDYPRARAFYHKALAASPRDARVRYRYGASLLQLGRATSGTKLAEARGHLERATVLDPHFAPAWVELARAYTYADTPLSERLRPERGDVALQLLLLHSRTGDREAARALWRDAFETRSEDRLRRAARAVLARMDWLAAETDAPPELVRE